MKAAPTCFGLQGNHHQGTTANTSLKLQACFGVDTDVVSDMAALCRHNTDNVCIYTETAEQSALNRHTVQLFTESDDTRCCNNTI